MHAGRLLVYCLTAAALLLLGNGCQPADTGETDVQPAPTPLAADAVLRVHWTGKRRLGVAASAYGLMRLWNLPESARLESQTLAKLAAAPGRILAPVTGRSGDASAALAPLLDDVLQCESYLEIRQPSNGVEQVAFAIRLEPARAAVWHRNLADALSTLTGTYPATRAGSWVLKHAPSQRTVELRQSGAWTLVGLGAERNPLLEEIDARIRSSQVPNVRRSSGNWVEAEVDLPWLLAQEVGPRPALHDWPRLSLAITGDGAQVITTGEAVFPHALPRDLEPWSIPAGQIHEPLTSFTAVRGLRPLFAAWPAWSAWQLGAAPDQITAWGIEGVPFQFLWATPGSNATNRAALLAEALMTRANPWLARYGTGGFVRAAGGHGAVWDGLPLLSPYVKPVQDAGAEFLQGGAVTNLLAGTNTAAIVYARPSFHALQASLTASTNLLCLDWEVTGPRVESNLYLLHVLRLVFHLSPIPPEATGLNWLRAVRPRLGNCTTQVVQTGPQRLAFHRESSLGLTALELHLLVDWLESNDFPRGLRTFQKP
jgi:hypothetical protein